MEYDLNPLQAPARDLLRRYAALSEHAAVGVFDLTADGSLTALNLHARRLFGVTGEEPAEERRLARLVPEEFGAELRRVLHLSGSGESAAFDCLLGLPGEQRPVRVALFPLIGERGTSETISGLCTDISTEAEMEGNSDESELRKRRLFEFNLEVQLLLEPESGRIVEANGAACEFYGYDPDEFRQLTLADLDEREETDGVPGAGLNRLQAGARVESCQRVKSGELRDVEITSKRIETPDGPRLYALVHDIGARKEVERELQESRERLELALTGAAVGIWDIDLVRATSYWSDRCKELLGYSPDEIDPNDLKPYENIHPEDRDRMDVAYRQHLAERVPYDLEIRVRHIDGSYYWMHTKGQAVWDAEGEPLRMSGTLRNIHEKRLVQEELRESRERFGFAIAGSQDGIWDQDMRTGQTWWSPRLFELLGYEEGEITPSREMSYRLMHPEDRIPTREAADAHIERGERLDVTYRMRVKDGSYRWFQVRGQAQRNEQGEAVRMCGSFTDVDEVFHAQRAQEARRIRIESQQAAILSFATDPGLAQGTFREACARITERSASVLNVGRCSVLMMTENRTGMQSIDMYLTERDEHFSGVVLDGTALPKFFAELERSRALVSSNPSEDPRFDEFPRDYILQRKVKSIMEAPVRRRGRLEGVVAASETCAEREWYEDEVDFLLNVAQQIARLLDAQDAEAAGEKQLELERQMLQAQKMESLGLMAGGVAHDFNNLLVVILGNADLLKRTIVEGSRQEELVEEISSASQRAAELCQQMLAFSGRGRLNTTRFDLQEIVRETSRLLHVRLNARTEVVLLPSVDTPPMEGDATQVRQVFMNLILNASEALPEDGGQILLRTGIRQLAPQAVPYGLPVPGAGPYLFCAVTDTGSGMDTDTLQRLFDPFFSTKFTGRGLGMAAVLGIVRAHGGGIRVDSTPGKGTRFEVWFPAASEEQELSTESAPPKNEELEYSGTVLLVDDEEAVCQLGEQMLALLGFEVVIACGGEDALELFRELQHELVLVVLDLTMPGMSGEEVHQRFKELEPRVPIILSSGYTELDVSRRIGSASGNVFLQKPYRLADLRRCVVEALD